MVRSSLTLLALLAAVQPAWAGAGDPQLKTDHPWYPGELSCSRFERLFQTQSELYRRVTGKPVRSEEDKALASWYWRNLNYFHCTEGATDYWGKGYGTDSDLCTHEYWRGLFGFGYGLCYATHAQWHGEMDRLLGPGRCRGTGVKGHHSFEVFLTGGAYGAGRWALLDHDVSTVIFSPDGSRLMSLTELVADPASRNVQNLTAARQRGWRSGGLHPGDPGSYASFNVAYYAGGYAAVPPMVHLRSGESLRRYLKPGLEDGKTFVYWGINYNTAGIPGPERGRSWVNQPQNMYQAKRDCGWRPGQARYANAVYTYTPDFASGSYTEGVIDESDGHVTFEFCTPYVIGAAPPPEAAKEKWGVYKPGCTGGLIIQGSMTCPVEVSTDRGKSWHKVAAAKHGMDLTDAVKGHSQYWIRFGAAAKKLAGAGLSLRTVCQCAPALIPHVKAGPNSVTFAASGRAVLSAGPNLDQVHVVAGKVPSASVTLQLAAPRKARAVHLYAASRQASGAPPSRCLYNIDCSTDGGKTWKPVLKDWKIIRHKPEPKDWWSHSFCYGDAALPGVAGPVRVRFTNTGGRAFTRPEAHLVYEVRNTSPVKVTFAWKEDGAVKTAAHTYEAPSGKADTSWSFDAGAKPETLWVEYAAD